MHNVVSNRDDRPPSQTHIMTKLADALGWFSFLPFGKWCMANRASPTTVHLEMDHRMRTRREAFIVAILLTVAGQYRKKCADYERGNNFESHAALEFDTARDGPVKWAA